MNWGKVFAGITLLLSVGAAIGFWWASDNKKAIYWAGASVINATFVF